MSQRQRSQLERTSTVLGLVAQLVGLERHPAQQKVVGSIPAWSAFGKQPINASHVDLSLSLPLPPFSPLNQ